MPESDRLRARERTARYPPLAWLRGVVSGWLLYRWILPRCDHAFVQSEQMRKDVALMGISTAKLTPVPMGVPEADVRPEPSSLVRSAQQPAALTIAYLGTLDSQRRLEVLIDMLGLLRGQGLNVTLLLVGDGYDPRDRSRLEARAEALEVANHLQITGFLPRHEALARVEAAEIGLSPFFPTPVLRSTSPTKLVEYLALGLPVVANDHPEQRRVLRESRAGVCVPWGAKHFARAVAWLARRGPQERQEMGRRGRQWVLHNRTYGRIADELERHYLQLIGRSLRER